jgi:hypothetical protein
MSQSALLNAQSGFMPRALHLTEAAVGDSWLLTMQLMPFIASAASVNRSLKVICILKYTLQG